MNEKASVKRIVEQYYSTLTDARTGHYDWWDLTCFVYAPLALAVGLVSLLPPYDVAAPVISTALTGVSVLAGLLFNLLAVLYDKVGKTASPGESPDKPALVSELFYAVSACVVFSIWAIASMCAWLLLYKTSPTWLSNLQALCAFYFSTALFVNMFVIVRRFFCLVEHDMRHRSPIQPSSSAHHHHDDDAPLIAPKEGDKS